MGGAYAGTGLHGHHAFNGHGHVNQHAVALLNALSFERIGKLAHLGQQLFKGHTGHGTIVSFKNNGGFVLHRRAHMLV